MMLSVMQTSVKEKVEVFLQDVALPSFSSFVQPTLNERLPGFWVTGRCPVSWVLGFHVFLLLPWGYIKHAVHGTKEQIDNF
jgi:hypothetical protein